VSLRIFRALFQSKGAKLPGMENHTQEALFVLPQPQEPTAVDTTPAVAAPPRLRRVDRSQLVMHSCNLDDLLEADHKARLVWALVQSWDLSTGVESKSQEAFTTLATVHPL
jgi:hypothetical protein